jgi:hypothetical protein
VLIDDGRVRLRVEDSDGVRVRTTVLEGGRISDHKGINLPGVKVSAPCMSEKDREDLRFALSLGVDMIALSFVRDAADVADVHAVMDELGARLPVIAKIEKPEAVDLLGPIVRAFDGLMVARGDLGVEIPLEQVPLVQKRCVRLAREHGKPVIVATQMLDSMIHHSHPTRAEASDVANAVLDGADALMLSGETSVGEYPIAAVETMARIIEAAEPQGLAMLPRIRRRPETRPRGTGPERRAHRRGPARGGPGGVHRDGCDGAPHGRAPRRDPAARVHVRSRGAQPSGTAVGCGDVRGAARGAHRRDGRRRWIARCWTWAAASPAISSSSSPAHRPAPPARRTRCACTSWAGSSEAVPPRALSRARRQQLSQCPHGRARCEIAFFSASDSSAYVRVSPAAGTPGRSRSPARREGLR